MNDYQEAQKWLEGFDWDDYYGLEADKHLATICEALQYMAEYEDLEEQGKLLKLPCAVDEAVYFIKSAFSYMSEPKEEKVRKIELLNGEMIFRTENRTFRDESIGKAVFLIREEAESALKELQR